MVAPRHIAMIMDGNGRWAKLRKRPRIYGHIRGSSRVKPIVRECGKLGVEYLTLYAFSSENWGRPSDEVGVLMKILKKYLVRERNTLMKNNVRLNTIGDIASLPNEVQQVLKETIQLTANNTGLVLTFALSYGSRQEILNAAKKIASLVADGKKSVADINESLFELFLSTAGMPDPDLIIRTSGEQRISNFLLWQAAYSEFYFTEKLWPDFDIPELHKALNTFANRTRRFGLTDEQIAELPL